MERGRGTDKEICRSPQSTAVDTRHEVALHRDANPRIRAETNGGSSIGFFLFRHFGEFFFR